MLRRALGRSKLVADVSMYPNLIAELLRRGYTDTEIRKVCSGNVLRVWRNNE